MMEEIEERDSSFMAFIGVKIIEAMGKGNKPLDFFWERFAFWTIGGLRYKYSGIWPEVTDTYFRSDAWRGLDDRARTTFAVWADVGKVLRDSAF
jgi:hypothetical protein